MTENNQSKLDGSNASKSDEKPLRSTTIGKAIVQHDSIEIQPSKGKVKGSFYASTQVLDRALYAHKEFVLLSFEGTLFTTNLLPSCLPL